MCNISHARWQKRPHAVRKRRSYGFVIFVRTNVLINFFFPFAKWYLKINFLYILVSYYYNHENHKTIMICIRMLCQKSSVLPRTTMPQGPQEAHGTGTGNSQLIPLQAGSLPCTGVPSIGFPSEVTHQQKPLVTWHCRSAYVPSSLHSGM